jgi:hypothetical protein
VPRRTFTDFDALDALLRSCERVVRHRDLLDLGVPSSTIMSRISPDGPWQRLLPGVLAAHRGIPTRRERILAAHRYSGEQSMLTGVPALAEYGVEAARVASTRQHMLVPHECRRTSHGFVVVERTRRLPEPVRRRGLPLAPLPRAVVDACRREENRDRVREIVAEVVQDRRCTVEEIVTEVPQAARQRTALTRAVLREIEAGIRSVAEAKIRVALRGRGLPDLEWNVEVYTPEGELVGIPDGYWEDLAVALQIDSMAWHLGPTKYRRTQKRQRTFARHGVLVLPTSPTDALVDIDQLVGDLMALREQAMLRPVPELVVRRPAA